jgi:hypothetical protein
LLTRLWVMNASSFEKKGRSGVAYSDAESIRQVAGGLVR